jgi:hypothetical protein
MNKTVAQSFNQQPDGDGEILARKRAVYTALLGGYEELCEQPTSATSELDFICFTDDHELTSTTWDIRHVDALFPLDMFRSQRALKIRGHKDLSSYVETLYIDNSVLLKQDPAIILDRWLLEGDVAISGHSFRDTVIDEFDEVLALSYDDPHRVNEQLLYYAELYPDVLLERPYWNGMIARRHTSEVGKMMDLWFDHVLRFSRRDQLSANVAFSQSSATVVTIEQDNNYSESHQWPRELMRKAELTKIGRRRLGPPIAEIARLHHQIEDLQNEVSHLPNEIERLRLRNDEWRAETDRVHEILHKTHESLSWKITRPLRFLRGIVKHTIKGS